VIDTQDNIDRVLEKIEEILTGGLVTLEKVRALRYSNDNR
jgi:PII-like signaling protein